MGPKNAIMGDDNFGTELPQTQIDDSEMKEIMSMAKYAKSAEFKRIQEYFQQRISYYQAYLPDGRAVTDLSPEEAMKMWPIANTIIQEYNYILGVYENAKAAASVRR